MFNFLQLTQIVLEHQNLLTLTLKNVKFYDAMSDFNLEISVLPILNT